jgi:hypothetical protein
MTRRTNGRLAGAAFLLYIAFGISSMVVMGRASGGADPLARIANIAGHPGLVHLNAVLVLLEAVCAIVLAVTLWALTREQDAEVAMLGLVFRTAEGVMGGLSVQRSLNLLWLAGVRSTNAPSGDVARSLAAFVFQGASSDASSILFALGSSCFSWLLLRGRMVPAWLAGLGVFASLLLVAVLPLDLAGVVHGSYVQAVWIPMAVFEVVLAAWLLAKGAAAPAGASPARA